VNQASRNLPARLLRPYRVIVFDWDGTAVADRAADALEIRRLIARLLALGVIVVVVTGTNLGNIDRQLHFPLAGAESANLFVLTNRGSEVYGFKPTGEPRLIWRLEATTEQNRQLDEIADRVSRGLWDRYQLQTDVIRNRLNRRKIDLIPLPEWIDPPKSRIAALAEAVGQRLAAAGLPGGIADVLAIVEAAAREAGLADSRLTSDAKHIEIGLTDKSDSVNWVIRNLATPRGIPPRDILVAGDEFGVVAGSPGSDSKMLTPETAGATFVSVGPEPNGVPPGVLWVPGGPAQFAAILREQIDLWECRRARSAEW
jgi:hydroxymethylpyrimidine pyrophosphatase-like HAD family hydrolase